MTFGGERRDLPAPFFVIATQNPLEQEGTYPLPEAQLDRFMFSVVVGYPTHSEENQIVSATTEMVRARPTRVLTAAQVREMQQFVRDTPVPAKVVRYAVALARATRPAEPNAPEFIKQFVDCGAGPRAGQYLVLAAKARAVLHGRMRAEFDEVRAAAIPGLRHRMFTNFTALAENISADDLVRQLVKAVPEPPADSKPIAVTAAPANESPTIQLPPEADALTLIREMHRSSCASVTRCSRPSSARAT